MKNALCLVAAISLSLSTTVLANDGNMVSPARPSSNACAPGGAARLTAASSGALLSRGGSFVEIREGAMLSAGDRILIRDGVATVALGRNVATKVHAGSMLTITEKDGVICAAQVSSNPAVVGEDDDSILGAPPVLVAGGLAVVGLGVGLGVGLSGHGQNNNNAALFALMAVSH